MDLCHNLDLVFRLFWTDIYVGISVILGIYVVVSV